MRRALKRARVLLCLLLILISSTGCIYLVPDILVSLSDGFNDSADGASDGQTGRGQQKPTSYRVDNDQFTYLGFIRNYGVDISGGSGSKTGRGLTVRFSCTCSLTSLEYNAVLYNARGEVLDIATAEVIGDMPKGENHEIDIDVSEEIFKTVTSVWVEMVGKSSDETAKAASESVSDKVCFVSDGRLIGSETVDKGKTPTLPEAPQKKHHRFVGWYTDPYLTKEYDGKAANACITLYAAFEVDADAVTETLREAVLPGIVTVYCKSYNTKKVFGVEYETESVTSQGSGVIFRLQNGFCYVLTNCHVARKEDGYSKHSIEIKDYKGNTYTGHIYANPSKTVGEAISEEYDLAVLYFKSTDTELKEVALGDTDAGKGDFVAALGSPKDAANTVTLGVSEGEVTIGDSNEELKDVDFGVTRFNAYINNGSSGGALVDIDMKLCGIVFAGNGDGEFRYGLAIPITMVHEFLVKYVYNDSN